MVAPATSNLQILQTKYDFSNTTDLFNRVVDLSQVALNNMKQTGIFLINQFEKRAFSYKLEPVVTESGNLCTRIERVFNALGSAPWISGFSGYLRALYGQAQAAAGIALIVLSKLGIILAKASNPLTDTDYTSKWKTLSSLGVELTMHGCLNTLRGTGETLLCQYTFGVGNIFLLMFTKENDFAPYFSYGDFT